MTEIISLLVAITALLNAVNSPGVDAELKAQAYILAEAAYKVAKEQRMEIKEPDTHIPVLAPENVSMGTTEPSEGVSSSTVQSVPKVNLIGTKGLAPAQE